MLPIPVDRRRVEYPPLIRRLLVHWLRPWCLLAALGAGPGAVGSGAAAGDVLPIDLTGPKGGIVGEIPFQSHNQKVVANDHGIFVTTGSRGSKKSPAGIHL